VKYGALSNGTGAVEIGWTLSPDHEAGQTVLQLRWRERGGPPVVAPTRRGFGTRLLERSMAAEPDGGVEMIFTPEGFVCVLKLRVRGDAGLSAGRGLGSPRGRAPALEMTDPALD
jgi:two-component sensor histidine kinase